MPGENNESSIRVKIDDVLKAKCPKTTLGGVTAMVVAQKDVGASRIILLVCEDKSAEPIIERRFPTVKR